jgi:hypothetical protein
MGQRVARSLPQRPFIFHRKSRPYNCARSYGGRAAPSKCSRFHGVRAALQGREKIPQTISSRAESPQGTTQSVAGHGSARNSRTRSFLAAAGQRAAKRSATSIGLDNRHQFMNDWIHHLAHSRFHGCSCHPQMEGPRPNSDLRFMKKLAGVPQVYPGRRSAWIDQTRND